jgi:hypothetical protein
MAVYCLRPSVFVCSAPRVSPSVSLPSLLSVSHFRHRRSVSLAHTASGRSCGSAFVTFHDAASADAAVRQPRQQINGRLAEVCEHMYCHFVIAV